VRDDDAALGEVGEVKGHHFNPQTDFEHGRQITEEEINAIKERIKRNGEEIRRLLQLAKERGMTLSITWHLRGVDGPGSSLDLPEFQFALTDGKTEGFNNLPSTPTIASEFKATVTFELADESDGDSIVYVAEDYGITDDKPYKTKGDVVFTSDGRLPEGQLVVYRSLNLG
jgi:hypothetical protein